ncbi:transcriptional regulator with XRE-family HTH domain [Actinomadura coerulea]|uniref:Transcriptional regulator with XRE-family HTH domain n=1 Tax=Actinomadura coerulea TaxID=46159 RepID=A0A7X0G4E4_9ACTN|nr:helix-turn-helix transcriptional regulator [Actinomadura coerulea]MBB6399171.1 transcriptional regulator with XRE-family HTH domain [Actinomadura coerulea]GGQ23911.1 transcriptional regulator [Actinomadura coerulea]
MTSANDLDPDNNNWHWLASDLRIWRTERNMTQEALGNLLGVTKAHVSNWESGRENMPMKHAETLDLIWRARGHFARLRRLAERTHDPGWWSQYIPLEAKASRVSYWALAIIPGLLQTEDYARTLLEDGQIIEDVEAAVTARMARQAVLERERPPELRILLNEAALEQPVGGPEVMRQQLAHLMTLSHRRNVILRTVPRNVGAHIGLDGSFTLLSGGNWSAAYMEANTGGRLTHDPTMLDDFVRRFDLIGSEALSASASRSHVARIMEAMK